MPPYTLHVISHTHWDREWYLTFQQFRMRFVDLMDNLLEILETDPEFKHFTLDGQAIVLEDYLQIRPEKRKIIEDHVRQGRILAGPWYVLNDEFLVSGEANIRCLMVGHRTAAGFGTVMKVGYIPDQFGSISQMPQILTGFGIDNAVFGRGLQIAGDRKTEFYWASPDGSRVLTTLMVHWYNNAQRFPEETDQAVEFTKRIRDGLAPHSRVEHLLLMNGVDHLEAQKGLPEIMSRVNERLDGDRLVHSSLPAYVDALRESIARNGAKLDTITGELREDRGNSVLAGTLSSRMYIKQANERTQTALERYAEPSASFACALGGDYPQAFLKYAWRFLLQNHPHDSICGCSIDQVHREMMPRFDQVQQIADEITARALNTIADRVKTDGDSLLVFNPLSWTRTDRVRAVMDFPVSDHVLFDPVLDPSRDFAWIRILDDQGREVPFAAIAVEYAVTQVLCPITLPDVRWVKRFTVEFVAEDVPSCGYRVYRVEKFAEKPACAAIAGPVACQEAAIENESVRLMFHDGRLTLERIGSEDAYPDISLFEDVGDVGDAYLYIKPERDVVVTSRGVRPKAWIIDRCPVCQTLRLEMSLTVPAGPSGDWKGRSDSTVQIPITTRLTVTRGVPRVDVVTTVDNRAEYHRLRALFPTGIGSNFSNAEGQFDILSRPIEIPPDWDTASTSHPQQSWVDVNDGKRGLCIINKGLPEYELYGDEGRTLAITLLRCVGRLGASETAPENERAPEGQCLGTHSFEHALYPHDGDWEHARCWKQAHQHNAPLMAFQTGPHDGDLPGCFSFLETSHDELIVSAIKKAEDSDLLVVRFWNPTARPITDAWVRLANSKSAKLLNLDEEVVGEVEFVDETARLTVGPKKIVTLGFEVRPSQP